MSGVNTKTLWNDVIPEHENFSNSVNDVAMNPDGTRAVAAVGNRVLLYDAKTGELLESLRGHKDVVTSVDYSFDGSHFASGGKDKVVVIWKASGQGKLKYNHSTNIQRIKYNPASFLLASCSGVSIEDSTSLCTHCRRLLTPCSLHSAHPYLLPSHVFIERFRLLDT